MWSEKLSKVPSLLLEDLLLGTSWQSEAPCSDVRRVSLWVDTSQNATTDAKGLAQYSLTTISRDFALRGTYPVSHITPECGSSRCPKCLRGSFVDRFAVILSTSSDLTHSGSSMENRLSRAFHSEAISPQSSIGKSGQ